MSDYKELLDKLRSKWLFPCNTEAADLIERLIRERDEARAKAIDEAAVAARDCWRVGDPYDAPRRILALKDKP
jgi:hypothetical protein